MKMVQLEAGMTGNGGRTWRSGAGDGCARRPPGKTGMGGSGGVRRCSQRQSDLEKKTNIQMKDMKMRESNIKGVAQALEAEFAPIATVVDFVHGKEQFLKPLTKAIETLDQACKDSPLDANESDFRLIVDMFAILINKRIDSLQTDECRKGAQSIFETVKGMLVGWNKQWKGTP